MIEYIREQNKNLLAIIVRYNYKQEGLKFFTTENNTQQIKNQATQIMRIII